MSTPLNSSVLKAFAVLRLFTPQRLEISAATVTSELGMNTATAHRFLLSLEEAGALTATRRGTFCLGERIESMGRLAEAANPLAARLQPIVAKLAHELGESVMGCRLGRRGPTCIAVAAAHRPISVNINVGTELPIDLSAQGRLFLADMTAEERKTWLQGAPEPTDLAQIAKDGYARNKGENESDIGALSVPIRNEQGQLILTLSAFGMLSRFDESLENQALSALKKAALEFEQTLR